MSGSCSNATGLVPATAVRNPITANNYTLTVATQNADGSSHDWLDDAIAFEVVDTRVAAGVANLRAKVEWRVSR